MKRIVVIMALLSIFLCCSTSVLAEYFPMAGHYTVSTQVTPLEDGFYRYDYAVTNVDQGPESIYPWVGLEWFGIEVPSNAILRNIQVPENSTSDPCAAGGRNGYWVYAIGTNPPLSPWGVEGFPESGYQWLAWYGQDTIYPQGTTAHFIFMR